MVELKGFGGDAAVQEGAKKNQPWGTRLEGAATHSKERGKRKRTRVSTEKDL